MRLPQSVTGYPWAIKPDVLAGLVSFAESQIKKAEGRFSWDDDETQPGALNVSEGVAIITLEGPLSRKETFFSWLFGGSTYEGIADQLRRAAADASVKAILLDVDSPGGEAFGAGELAGLVRSIGEQKPVTAYVSGMGASAAYWVASAAGEIVTAPASLIGSIGAVISVWGKRDDGSYDFISSQSPNKRPDPTKPEGQAEYQRIVDDLAAVFIADVAANRGVSAETVLADFGQGGVRVGSHAVEAGLADRVETRETLLTQLAEATRPAAFALQATPTPAAAGGETKTMSWLKEFAARLTGEDKQELTAHLGEQAKTTDPKPATPPAATEPPRSEVKEPAASVPLTSTPNPDLEALKAQFAVEQQKTARLEAQLLEKEAQGFLTEHRGHFHPSEAAALCAGYLRAAQDDAAMPVGEGQEPRLKAFKAALTARPQHHLTEELLGRESGGAGLFALANPKDTPKAGDPITPEREEALLALTPWGQAKLDQRKADRLSANGKGH